MDDKGSISGRVWDFHLHHDVRLSPGVQSGNKLLLYKAKVAVCFEMRTKHSAQSEQHVKFFMLNLVVHKDTARL